MHRQMPYNLRVRHASLTAGWEQLGQLRLGSEKGAYTLLGHAYGYHGPWSRRWIQQRGTIVTLSDMEVGQQGKNQGTPMFRRVQWDRVGERSTPTASMEAMRWGGWGGQWTMRSHTKVLLNQWCVSTLRLPLLLKYLLPFSAWCCRRCPSARQLVLILAGSLIYATVTFSFF